MQKSDDTLGDITFNIIKLDNPSTIPTFSTAENKILQFYSARQS
jgi:hypothetical protein